METIKVKTVVDKNLLALSPDAEAYLAEEVAQSTRHLREPVDHRFAEIGRTRDDTYSATGHDGAPFDAVCVEVEFALRPPA
jgi:hypothetical protein